MALGQVILEELSPGRRKRVTFKASMTGAATVVAGYGGWEKVARPRRKSLTNWIGRDPLSLEIPFLIDKLVEEDGQACEAQVKNIELIAGIEGGGAIEPSVFRLKSTPARLIPHGYGRARHNKFFIESLTWDRDQTIVGLDGLRIRIGGTLVVTQETKDTRLEKLANEKSDNRRQFYTVKKDDTLQKIAAREDVYGDAKKWRSIAEANNIRDPSKLKVGQKLTSPRF